jgi:hypothetical protein
VWSTRNEQHKRSGCPLFDLCNGRSVCPRRLGLFFAVVPPSRRWLRLRPASPRCLRGRLARPPCGRPFRWPRPGGPSSAGSAVLFPDIRIGHEASRGFTGRRAFMSILRRNVSTFNTAGDSAVIRWRRDILAAGPIANPDTLARLQGRSRGSALRLVRKIKECGVGGDPASHRPAEDQGHQNQSPHVSAPVLRLHPQEIRSATSPAAGTNRGPAIPAASPGADSFNRSPSP